MKKMYILLLVMFTLGKAAFSQITSTGAGGNWSSTGTWVGGVVPGAGDNVIIANGATVTIDVDADAQSITVGQGTSGILQFAAGAAQTLTVGGNVTVANGATLRSALTGTQTGHLLSLSGSITNNGTFDFSTNGGTASSAIEFTGATNETFSGTGAITDVESMVINKGVNATLELNTTNFTFEGNSVTPGSGDNAFLDIVGGIFKLSGTFSMANGLFTGSGTYEIADGAQLWLNNPNYTVTARAGNLSVLGTLRISAGTLNIGLADGNRLNYSSGSTIIINGGTINLASRMTSSGPFALNYTQTGGVFNVCTVASSSTGFASFDIRPEAGNSSFTMSGGSIVIQNANPNTNDPGDYSNFADNINITGGTLQFGNAASTGAQTYSLSGTTPGFVVNNAVPGHSVTLLTDLFVTGSTNITTGSTVVANGFRFRQSLGSVFTNAGTFDGTGANSALVFAGTTTQILNGDGAYTTPLNWLIVNNPGGLAIANSVPSDLILSQLSMANGNINTGVTTLTLGTSAAATGTFNYSFGTIVGKFKRWISTTSSAWNFPVGTSVSQRDANINFTTAPTAGGTLTTEWVNTPGGSNGLPLVEGTINVNNTSDAGFWRVITGDGLTGGTYTGTFTATSIPGVTDYTRLVLVKRTNSASPWTLNGTHITTTGDNTIAFLSRSGMTGFSEFGIGGDVAVNTLPIKIEYFSGRKQSSNNQLDWKVNCTSAPSVTIVLQRGTDGRSFENISTVNATAVRCLQPFNYTDANAVATISYYRLKVTEPTGKVTYSPVVAIFNNDKGFEILGLMPNIIQSTSVLNVSSATASKMEIVVTDISGKVVSKQTVSLVAGSNLVSLNFGKLAAGSYNITGYTTDGQKKTIRFVKQ